MKFSLLPVIRATALLTGCLYACSTGCAASISDVRQQIDPVSGQPKDKTTRFTVSGIVSARATLADGRVLAYIQAVGEAGIPILASGAEAENLIPRNQLNLSGSLVDGPLGTAVLTVTAGSVTLEATNKLYGIPEPRGADFFKDASSLAGRYVSLTNVTFVDRKFDASGKARVKGDSGEVNLLVTSSLKDRDVPDGALNIAGVPVRVEGEWRLLAARFLSVNNKASLALATKRTCITCHNPDIKAVGPAYRDVAAKYKDDPEAATKLQTQIEKGGGGKWGVVAMPALGALVPPEDRKTLVEWILGYRWDAILAN